MIYLQVDHVEDDGVDLFSFDTLERAVKYIEENDLFNWGLSDTPFDEPEEHTHIQ